MTIPLSDLPAADEWRRDRWGRYLILPPGERQPVGYTRMTTVAKALDDGGGLAPWKATLTVVGTIMRRGLRTQWEALIASTGGDPWYAGEQSKKDCKRLVEECAAAGGSTDRRDTGTSLHTLTALDDLGRHIDHLTEETARDLDAYRSTLDAAGITVVDGLIEQTVVLDDYRVAGTFDRGYSVPGFERPLIGDLKCGSDLRYSWASICVQLAGYAHGDAIYRQGPATDGSEDVRLPMPEVDQDHGLIVWLNAGTGQCELFLVDLAAGWEAFQHSIWARAWRKRRDLSVPLADWVAGTEDDEVGSGPGVTEASPGAAAPPAEEGSLDNQLDELDRLQLEGEVRAWLQGRINAIGAHPQARVDLRASWPADLPTLRTSTTHTAEQLEAMENLLGQVEKRHALPFPPAKPGVDYLALVVEMFPNSTEVKEQ